MPADPRATDGQEGTMVILHTGARALARRWLAWFREHGCRVHVLDSRVDYLAALQGANHPVSAAFDDWSEPGATAGFLGVTRGATDATIYLGRRDQDPPQQPVAAPGATGPWGLFMLASGLIEAEAALVAPPVVARPGS
ncbi:hypothetical protein KBTX_03940 [wastewater metagenome]|uniref:Uncharacterized protein n=3 Tax=root TaxID=1 RepID=A0A5B8RIP8_9ZZZZ|nr:hypothetical protein KBTEX_03940 [uncultured organism]